jgi:hypothetical protein
MTANRAEPATVERVAAAMDDRGGVVQARTGEQAP